MSKFIKRTAEVAEQQRLIEESAANGLESVRHVLAVASGKGGVGKTTIAVNLAVALAAEGLRVGLLDADVYGPSVPLMLGLQQPAVWEEQTLIPACKFGISIMSLGILSEAGQAIVWRGPMVSKAIHQLINQVRWGDLDCLVVDLPPGTGDPSISVAQHIPDASVLMVTTPQEIALADVRRAIEMFRRMDLNIVGLVENMSYFMCGHAVEPIEIFGIFGAGGGQKLSEETGLPLLGTIPIEMEIGRAGDAGVPLMVSQPDSAAGKIFQSIAEVLKSDILAATEVRQSTTAD